MRALTCLFFALALSIEAGCSDPEAPPGAPTWTEVPGLLTGLNRNIVSLCVAGDHLKIVAVPTLGLLSLDGALRFYATEDLRAVVRPPGCNARFMMFTEGRRRSLLGYYYGDLNVGFGYEKLDQQAIGLGETIFLLNAKDRFLMDARLRTTEGTLEEKLIVGRFILADQQKLFSPLPENFQAALVRGLQPREGHQTFPAPSWWQATAVSDSFIVSFGRQLHAVPPTGDAVVVRPGNNPLYVFSFRGRAYSIEEEFNPRTEVVTYRSDDAGLTWSKTAPPSPDLSPARFFEVGENLIVSRLQQIFRLDPDTWKGDELEVEGLTATADITAVAEFNDRVYVGTTDGLFVKDKAAFLTVRKRSESAR